MMSFKEFLKIDENLWGKIPVRGKKPSDGRGGYSLSSNTPSTGASPTMGPGPQAKMMRKHMRKI